MNYFSAREGGFSLVELMVAVGIIGIMSSVAVPKYQKFRVNAAQSEAQATLSSIYTLQQLFYTENDHYGKYEYTRTGPGTAHTKTDDEIGFHPPATARYHYTGDRFKADGSGNPDDAEAVSFRVVADAQKPLASCSKKTTTTGSGNSMTSSTTGEIDSWCINENKVLTNIDGEVDSPCTDDKVNDGGCS